MNKTTCRECKEEIKHGANRCPHCSADLRNFLRRHPILSFILFMIFLSVILASLNGPDEVVTTAPVANTLSIDTNFPYQVGTTYFVDTTELQGTSMTEVNLWQSYDNRTKVGSVEGGEAIVVMNVDQANNYCEADMGGWLSCEWLVEAQSYNKRFINLVLSRFLFCLI